MARVDVTPLPETRPDSAFAAMGDSGHGIPGWFIAVFILVIVGGIGTFFWRIWVARNMAEDAGLDPNAAARAAMLSQLVR